MNFKILILIALFSCAGCGVKSRPTSPPETAVKSYIDSYIDPVDSVDQKTNPVLNQKKK